MPERLRGLRQMRIRRWSGSHTVYESGPADHHVLCPSSESAIAALVLSAATYGITTDIRGFAPRGTVSGCGEWSRWADWWRALETEGYREATVISESWQRTEGRPNSDLVLKLPPVRGGIGRYNI